MTRVREHRPPSLTSSRSLTAGLCRAWLAGGLLLGLGLEGCSLTYETTKSARSPVEQLLLTQSLQRGLVDVTLPVRPGQSVVVETVGLTPDQAFVTALVQRWLSREGLLQPKDGNEALIVRVTLEAFGTLQDGTFVGMPAVGGGLLPIAIPELALYKVVRQRGHARFSLDFIEKKTGRVIRSTPTYDGDAHIHEYTFFFAFHYRDTDILPPMP